MVSARSSAFYRRGREHLARAVTADETGAKDAAVIWYGEACEQFLAGLAYDKTPASRKKIMKGVQGYLARAETLSQQLERKTSPEEKEKVRHKAMSQPKEDGFAMVAGLGDVKRALREAVILPMIHPKLFTGARKPWKGVLLYGPPGTGKSHVAAALSKEADCTFISLSSSDLVSKHVGDSERAVRKVFEEARKKKPSVIFLDEIDSIGRSRDAAEGSNSEASRRLLTEILKQMDGVGSDMEGITLIAATNHPKDIDAALRRRFEKRVYVPMPGPKARSKILRLHLGDSPKHVNVSPSQLDTVAKQADGYSGSDLANVANEALMQPVRKCLRATHFRYVPKQRESGLWEGMMNMVLDNVMSSKSRRAIEPCNPSDPGAFKASILDPDFPADQLQVPRVEFRDLKTALSDSKPSVDKKVLKEYAEFAATFGDKTGIKDFEDREEDNDEEFVKQPIAVNPPRRPRDERALVAS